MLPPPPTLPPLDPLASRRCKAVVWILELTGPSRDLLRQFLCGDRAAAARAAAELQEHRPVPAVLRLLGFEVPS